MKKLIFIVAVIAVLTLAACGSKEATQPTTTQPSVEPAASPDNIDTSELDQLEQDLATIEQGY